MDFLKPLSTRAKNVCLANGIDSYERLEEIISENGLLQLKRCGKSVEKELKTILENRDRKSNPLEIEEAKTLGYFEDNIEEAYFCQLALIHFLNLDTKAKNIARKIGGSVEFNPISFVEKTIITEQNLNHMSMVGDKTKESLVVFIDRLKNILFGIMNRELSLYENLSSRLYIIMQINFLSDKEFQQKLSSNTLSILEFIDVYFYDSQVLTSIEKDFIKFYLNKHLQEGSDTNIFEHIGFNHKISREGVRQKSKSSFVKIQKLLNSISFMDIYFAEKDILLKQQNICFNYSKYKNTNFQYSNQTLKNLLELKNLIV
jgi:hypothetical protein